MIVAREPCAAQRCSDDAVALGVRPLQLEPAPGTRAVGADAALGVERAVEEHPLETDVVVEVLQVAEATAGAEGRGAQGARSAGEVEAVRLTEPEPSIPTTAP